MKYPRLALRVDGDPAGKHTVTIIQGERQQVLSVDGWLGNSVAFYNGMPRMFDIIRSAGSLVEPEIVVPMAADIPNGEADVLRAALDAQRADCDDLRAKLAGLSAKLDATVAQLKASDDALANMKAGAAKPAPAAPAPAAVVVDLPGPPPAAADGA